MPTLNCDSRTAQLSTQPPIQPLLVTMGEPAGSGADILLSSFAQWSQLPRPVVVVDDPTRLSAAAETLNLDIPFRVLEPQPNGFQTQLLEAQPLKKDAINIYPLSARVPYTPGAPTPDLAWAVLESLDIAITAAQNQQAAGLVTLPIQKNILYEAGFTHPGHTEYLAEKTDSPTPVMMLATEGLRVVPLTIHQSLASVSSSLSQSLIIDTCKPLAFDLTERFNIPAPRIAIAALNPHAGEDGTMGTEEIEIISPAIAALQGQGLHVAGPFPSDTLFHPEARQTYDAVVCMYHDQALIPLKTIDFWGGVNITLGLPIIRTSPDHGTAIDLAGTGKARPDSFITALKSAHAMAQVAQQREHTPHG